LPNSSGFIQKADFEMAMPVQGRARLAWAVLLVLVVAVSSQSDGGNATEAEPSTSADGQTEFAFDLFSDIAP